MINDRASPAHNIYMAAHGTLSHSLYCCSNDLALGRVFRRKNLFWHRIMCERKIIPKKIWWETKQIKVSKRSRLKLWLMIHTPFYTIQRNETFHFSVPLCPPSQKKNLPTYIFLLSIFFFLTCWVRKGTTKEEKKNTHLRTNKRKEENDWKTQWKQDKSKAKNFRINIKKRRIGILKRSRIHSWSIHSFVPAHYLFFVLVFVFPVPPPST